MKRQIALKTLTSSDLTLFEWHFRNNNAGNQKAINLNANVFVQALYPNLAEISAARDGRFGVDLYIYGPNGAPELNLQRKVIKDTSYKNWRLDGEMIANPIGEETRFNILSRGDLAVIEFTGKDFPVSARMVLISASSEHDEPVHRALAPLVSSMATVTISELSHALNAVGVPDNHPIHNLLVDDELEDAAQSGAHGAESLFRRRQARRVTRSELEQARRNAGDIGYRGETLLQRHFERMVDRSELTSFQWVSDQNAVAPYDFELIRPDGEHERIDVKATQGEFSRRLHVSMAELHAMADASVAYRLYRLSELEEASGTLRISEQMATFAQNLLQSLHALPSGVSPDSFSIEPSAITFGEPMAIRIAPSEP